MPILLDVGTNNRKRLDDPLYIGWRHERISGPEYDDFVDTFVQAVKRKFPRVLPHWEDSTQPHAGPLLGRYRDQLRTFNDDIQGTAAVTTGTLLAAVAGPAGGSPTSGSPSWAPARPAAGSPSNWSPRWSRRASPRVKASGEERAISGPREDSPDLDANPYFVLITSTHRLAVRRPCASVELDGCGHPAT